MKLLKSIITFLCLISLHQTFAISYTQEIERIQNHLTNVEINLRNTNTSHLNETQKQNRGDNLDILHQYMLDEKFPNNGLFPGEQVPFFRGSNGNLCAVGFLMYQDKGYRDYVDNVVATNNNVKVMDITGGPIFNWLDENGFTQYEASLIQPTYKYYGVYYKKDGKIYHAGNAGGSSYEGYEYEKDEDGFTIGIQEHIFGNKFISDDIENFVIMEDNYSRDSNNVYYKGGIIQGAKANSFEILSAEISKDQNSLYLSGIKIDGLDPDSYTDLTGGYRKDDSNIYYMTKMLTGAHIDSFTSLGRRIGKDDNYVYAGLEKVSGITDIASFRPIGSSKYMDNHSLYETDAGWGSYNSNISIDYYYDVDPFTYNRKELSDFFGEITYNKTTYDIEFQNTYQTPFQEKTMEKIQDKLGEVYGKISQLGEEGKIEKIELIKSRINKAKGLEKYQNPNHQKFLNYLLTTLEIEHNFE